MPGSRVCAVNCLALFRLTGSSRNRPVSITDQKVPSTVIVEPYGKKNIDINEVCWYSMCVHI